MSQRRVVVRYPAFPNNSPTPDQPFERLHLHAEVQDISRGIIGVVLSMELVAGIGVEIVLPGNTAIRKRAKLRHTGELFENRWLAAFAFEEDLTREELRTIRANLVT